VENSPCNDVAPATADAGAGDEEDEDDNDEVKWVAEVVVVEACNEEDDDDGSNRLGVFDEDSKLFCFAMAKSLSSCCSANPLSNR